MTLDCVTWPRWPMADRSRASQVYNEKEQRVDILDRPET
jgi:hypothetical protein